MCWRARRVYFGDWGAPRLARGLCTDHLVAALGHGAKAQSFIDDAVMVVSELVSNAATVGGTSIDLELDLHRDYLRIAVGDDGFGDPELLNPGSEEVRGRGLQVVSTLADSWGVEDRGTGKQVWADLRVPVELTVRLECTAPAYA